MTDDTIRKLFHRHCKQYGLTITSFKIIYKEIKTFHPIEGRLIIANISPTIDEHKMNHIMGTFISRYMDDIYITGYCRRIFDTYHFTVQYEVK